MILSHKQDMAGAASKDDIRSKLQLDTILDRTCWVEESELSGMNTSVMNSMIEQILKQKESKRNSIS